MSTFPGSPILLKGALVSFELPKRIPSIILFQYNPETMTRRLEARSTTGGESSDRSEAFRLTGPPRETINFSIEIDASDQLEKGDPVALMSGVNPALASLELLLYPKSRDIAANTMLAQSGRLEIIPPEAPFTVFVWGMRVVPVRVKDFSITEEAFDPLLNPTRAKVELSLQVLGHNDLKLEHPGRSTFMTYHIYKEQISLGGLLSAASDVGRFLKII